ncbi:preprotein translocase subunit SecA [Kineobactrum sediminis]|nr:preprotein translocase subunit SecA [Kineobactrum sediminis]
MTAQVSMLRPGVVTGQYPQRPDLRFGWLDRQAARLTGALRQQLGGRSDTSPAFVSWVNALEEGLLDISDDQLKGRIAALRPRLYGLGFDLTTVAESFSLVRETSRRNLGLRHHDVQISGGFAMLQGKIAEMETGEGKTLTALLPACTAAFAGVPVHIITVNDFLVARDAQTLAPAYAAMGLSVGVICEGMDIESRRAAYRADITYCTNKQVAFDYLKDSLLLEQESRSLHLQLEGLYREYPRTERLLMRGLCFAIIDEADSVLIDEARTPLVISAPGKSDGEPVLYQQALDIADALQSETDFVLRKKEKQVELTALGARRLLELTRGLGGIWSGSKRSREMVTQALVARYLYFIDVHYLIRDDKVLIIDEYTGRVMEDRAWEQGLHQMIQTKEGCALTGRQETLARISYQRFFRRYLRLSGMTGTAAEVTAELWSTYHIGVKRIPSHRPLRRHALKDKVFIREYDKWQSVLEVVVDMYAQGRPVLLGTRTVAESEHLANLLSDQQLPHVVLNAREDVGEASIIADAGRAGNITVATNMAGRGTDIKLDAIATKHGGLHVIATCYHEARRIDRQLFGRSGRQGDPGTFQAIVSLEDEVFTHFLGGPLLASVRRLGSARGTVPRWLSELLRRLVQYRAEAHHRRIRGEMMTMDENLGDMLAFSGRGE